MRYPGGKSASGAYQQIINQIPPHRVYVEAFVGGGAVFERKAPAASSILMDLDAEVVRYWEWRCGTAPELKGADLTVIHGDATRWLSSFPWVGDEFVYLDPPYHPDSRTKKKIYTHELDDGGHRELLAVLATLPVPFALSGYRCALYDDASSSNGWRRIDYPCMTRRGVRTESVWMNYQAPASLAEYGYVGSGFRERERIKRKVSRWMAKLEALEPLERAALLSAMSDRFG
jgi:site-specific DNA-adenine methylase